MAYYIPFIIIYEVSWAAVQISHLAYIPKTNPDMFVRYLKKIQRLPNLNSTWKT